MGALNIAKIGHRNLRTEYQTSGEVFIPIARVKPLVKILMMNKVDLRSLLKDTGLQFQDLSETDQTINFLQYKQLIINARRLLPHHPFALYLGEQSFLHHDGLLAARIMSSENVQQAMELLTKYQPLFTQILGFKFEMQKSGLGVLTLTPKQDLGDALPYFMEFTCSVIYSLGRFFMGGVELDDHDKAGQIHFSFDQPKVIEAYDEFFSVPVFFNQDQNRIVLSEALLKQPLVFYNKDSAQLNEQCCQERLSEVCPDNTVLDRVKFIIRRDIFQELSLDTLASELCMSPRTLRRHLQSHETSYKELLEEERKRVALAHIRKQDISIETLAESLGYSDASSFSRAFKRWYGLSPKNFKPN
ncbi:MULTISPECIES: AraC family transcriptional regulator [unclassified Oleiphilus]|nr:MULTISPECIES: AraC family transcriptional regulator [unclassified Oleiphilus]KZZ39087.1 hypothetical protein A3757_01065 [Oleiphilus sp. HI0117]KZZ39599.1 hypothetical protein A3756_08070 [Oleiphilus sp. HI0086]KZZ54000.1 hypothetical protein A3761_15395 [Oleiphilus sp. HI0123]